jgi:hypothetical protein
VDDYEVNEIKSKLTSERSDQSISGLANEQVVIVYDKAIREYEPLRIMLDYVKRNYTYRQANTSDTKDFMFTNVIVNGKNYGNSSTAIRSIGLCLGFYSTKESDTFTYYSD